jgi:Domain of unknown function (DUF6431)
MTTAEPFDDTDGEDAGLASRVDMMVMSRDRLGLLAETLAGKDEEARDAREGGRSVLIVADDPVGVEADLRAGRLSCPRCQTGVLGGWGRARRRELRTRLGSRSLRPRRGRCRDRRCGATHVLLPDVCLVRRPYSVEVIGEAIRVALLDGLRSAADELGVPIETVRGWRARLRSRAGIVAAHFWRWATALDGALTAPGAQSSAVDAIEAIGLGTRAAALSAGSRPEWSWASALTGGALLLPFNTTSPWPAPE